MGIYLGGQQVVTYAGGVNSDIFATEGYVQEAVAAATEDMATKDYVEQNGGKIDSISVNGEVVEIDENKNVNLQITTNCDTELSETSMNPVQNKVITAALASKTSVIISTTDIEDGVTELAEGTLYCVIE